MINNNRYISYIERTIDEQVLYMYNIIYKYINEEDVIRISQKWAGKYEEIRSIQNLHKKIVWNTLENNLIFDIILSFKDQDYVITKDGQYSNQFYFNNYFFHGMEFEQYESCGILSQTP